MFKFEVSRLNVSYYKIFALLKCHLMPFTFPVLPGTSSSGSREVPHQILSRNEVIRRLRDRSEPILLYGETEDEANLRLKKLELENTEISVGLKNDPK